MAKPHGADTPAADSEVRSLSGWQALAWGTTCAAGTLVFLALVADEVRRVCAGFDLLEKREGRKLWQHLGRAETHTTTEGDVEQVTTGRAAG